MSHGSSTLTIETRSILTAPLGPPSVLPPLREFAAVHESLADRTIADVLGPNASDGQVPSILPYTVQRFYDRDLERRDVPVAVLKNEWLRAVFLLEQGGRLWSLTHLPTGRELLHTNEMLQPANLAIRNAWYAGGVEWNIGTIGHCPFTASPLHAARLETPDGTPVLRFYEWERIREVAFQVDILLPAGSPVLFAVPRIRNHHGHDTPMYWWSNIAVPEAEDTRVLVPASSAYAFRSREGLSVVPVPGGGAAPGADISYPGRAPEAADWFFQLEPDRRAWIAALDGQGKGLVQTSTERLRARKLFVWGHKQGGRHWQRWLSGNAGDYCEIQAGLAPTQLQHVSMPAQAVWSWTEAYGLLSMDPAISHGPDWSTAVEGAATALDELVSTERLDEIAAETAALADRDPDQMLWAGSGWGALEARRRALAGDNPSTFPGTPFSETTLGTEQAPWLELLAGGGLPDQLPSSYLVSPAWRAPLMSAAPTWLCHLHLGVGCWAEGDRPGAQQHWELSLSERVNPIAARNLGLLALLESRPDQAARWLRQSWDLMSGSSWEHAAVAADEIFLDLLSALVLAEPAAALALIDQTGVGSGAEKAWIAGRVRLAEARAALGVGDYDRCRRVLAAGIVIPEVREGETSFGDVWEQLETATSGLIGPLPYDFDFRAV